MIVERVRRVSREFSSLTFTDEEILKLITMFTLPILAMGAAVGFFFGVLVTIFVVLLK